MSELERLREWSDQQLEERHRLLEQAHAECDAAKLRSERGSLIKPPRTDVQAAQGEVERLEAVSSGLDEFEDKRRLAAALVVLNAPSGRPPSSVAEPGA